MQNGTIFEKSQNIFLKRGGVRAYLSDDELLDIEGGFTGWDDGTGAGAEETLEQALAEEQGELERLQYRIREGAPWYQRFGLERNQQLLAAAFPGYAPVSYTHLDAWKPGYESLWVRQSRPYAGDTYGLHLPLLAGTEVSLSLIHICSDACQDVK